MVGDQRRTCHQVDLVGVLDAAHGLDQTDRGDKLPTREPRTQPFEPRDAHMVGLESHAPGSKTVQCLGDLVKQLPPRFDDLHTTRLLARVLQIAEVGEQRSPLRRQQHAAVGADVATGVADVGQVGNEERIDALLSHALQDAFLAVRVPHARCSFRSCRASR